jgi:DNA-binding transcriptional ArsR family regulator
MGTSVQSGTATAVLITTGVQTYLGSMARSITGDRTQTSFDVAHDRLRLPLQRRAGDEPQESDRQAAQLDSELRRHGRVVCGQDGHDHRGSRRADATLQPTVSEHLKILSQAGLIRGKRIKQWTFYRRDEGKIKDLKARILAKILSRWFAWYSALVVVRPETLTRCWHRASFRLLWRWKSRPGRPQIPLELREPIRRSASYLLHRKHRRLPLSGVQLANQVLDKE